MKLLFCIILIFIGFLWAIFCFAACDNKQFEYFLKFRRMFDDFRDE